MKHFRPKDSPYFGTLEKITTIIPEGRQLIIGDPVYCADDIEVEDSENPNDLSHEELITRISLPASTESIGVFEVSSGETSDEFYGYYLEFIEPDPNGQGYSEEHFAELGVDSAALIACDETSSRHVLLEEISVRKFDWTFHHKPLGPSVRRSWFAPGARFLDDGNVRGILIELIGDGIYDVHAVYEGDHNQDSVIGILVITRPVGVGDF